MCFSFQAEMRLMAFMNVKEHFIGTHLFVRQLLLLIAGFDSWDTWGKVCFQGRPDTFPVADASSHPHQSFSKIVACLL